MTIKLVVLKSGEQVIADTKEVVSEDKIKGYLLNNPQTVSASNSVFLLEGQEDDGRNVEITLSPYILLSSSQDIVIAPDWVVTIVDPLQSLIELYQEKLNVKDS
jgi:hypothetical protein